MDGTKLRKSYLCQLLINLHGWHQTKEIIPPSDPYHPPWMSPNLGKHISVCSLPSSLDLTKLRKSYAYLCLFLIILLRDNINSAHKQYAELHPCTINNTYSESYLYTLQGVCNYMHNKQFRELHLEKHFITS
jgi:hypothetical protein